MKGAMTRSSVNQILLRSKPGIIALFDPDRMSLAQAKKMTTVVGDSGVSAILIGSSLLISPHFDEFVRCVKKNSSCPVILFPGGSHQVSKDADAIFFLSLLSGRNPEFLIGEQVKAVFLIRSHKLEVIPVGYLLIESGACTAVEYISNTKPIPRNKPEICIAHALAGEFLGSKYIYLEAGSGALRPVPVEMIRETKKSISIPLIVGGGIRKTRDARQALDAGADFIVLGSVIERSPATFREIMRSVQ